MDNKNFDYFSFANSNKSIKTTFPLGFPPVRASLDDISSDVTRRSYFWFKNGKWESVSYNSLKRFLIEFLEKKALESEAATFYFYNTSAKRNITETLNKILLLDAKPLKNLQTPEAESCLVFFNNSVLKFTPNKPVVFYNPDPEFYNRVAITNYAPENSFNETSLAKFNKSSIYKWLEFITDKDQAYLDVIQEICGLCLTPQPILNKAFFLYGAPNTGKSTFLRVLEILVGFENVDGVNLDNFTDQIYLEKFDRVLLNLSYDNSEDLSTQYLNQSWGLLKRSISSESFSINPKYKDTHLLIPIAKHFFAINKLPKFQPNESFFKRVLILPTSKALVDSYNEINTSYYLNFIEYREALVTWALYGLQRLLNNKGLTKCEAIKTATETYFDSLRRNSKKSSKIDASTTIVDDLQTLLIDFAKQHIGSEYTKDELFVVLKSEHAIAFKHIETKYKQKIPKLLFYKAISIGNAAKIFKEQRVHNRRSIRILDTNIFS